MEDTLQEVFKGTASKDIDFIQYAIFMPEKKSDSDEEDMLTYLKDTLDMINSLIQPIVKDYIWQKDRFHLSIAYDQNKDPPYPFLFGASRFGDCINDEWFIVYLLQLISNRIPESIISLADNDGDVLLIEAAHELPSWLDPSNSQNRVYLMNGQVHIIPLPSSPADILMMPASTGQLRREQAIQFLRQQTHSLTSPTLPSPAIQQSIDDRLKQISPGNSQHSELHHARCILPKKAAFVLLSEPQLITLAVEAFYYRDPDAMKACALMKTFSPRADEDADTIITFTKTTYAQTVNQKFYAPKPFRLPSKSATRKEDREKFKYAELGMKITCGLEMLYCQHAQATTTAEAEMEDPNHYNFEKDVKYQAYVQHLTKLGYFQSEKKGSQLYKLLEMQSKEQYLLYKKQTAANDKRFVSLDDLDVEDEETAFDGARLDTRVRQTIDTLLSRYSDNALQLLMKANAKEEDSDDWMNVDPQQLEELLMKRMGLQQKELMAELAKDMCMGGSSDGIDLESIMNNLENFVEHSKSGFEGVELANKSQDYADEDASDYEDEEFGEGFEDEDLGALKFDLDKFMSILKGTADSLGENDTSRITEVAYDEGSQSKDEEKDLAQVMEEMDQEIYSHDKINQSFVRTPKDLEHVATAEEDEESNDEEEDVNAPVDIELNLVKNVLESFKSQQGLPGPVGTMLNQFGIVLPGDLEEDSADQGKGSSSPIKDTVK